MTDKDNDFHFIDFIFEIPEGWFLIEINRNSPKTDEPYGGNIRVADYSTPWLVEGKVRVKPEFRLFCFPYAGGGASMYREWQAAMPHGIQVCAVQLPGRESRMAETPLTRLEEVIASLTAAILLHCDVPFAFFGHSLGAKVSFELIRSLRRNGEKTPEHLIVAGARAPHIPEPSPLHELSDHAFIDALRRYSAMPEEVLRNKGLMQLFMPVLRADFSIDETYVFREESPLDCPITAFGGSEDHEADHAELLAWEKYTGASFACRIFPGDHFFIRSSREAVLHTLLQTVPWPRKLSPPT